jgi:hypothetical protein
MEGAVLEIRMKENTRSAEKKHRVPFPVFFIWNCRAQLRYDKYILHNSYSLSDLQIHFLDDLV